MSRSTAIKTFILILILVLLLIWLLIPARSDNFTITEIPELKGNELIIKREGFTVCFDTLKSQAQWVAWEITREELTGAVERSDRFRSDPLLSRFTDMATSYSRSGFDRGHLAPAGDMTWSDSAMTHSFYYSNISPQDPKLNRGLWKKTEEMARNAAEKNGRVFVITGPLFFSSDTIVLNGRLPVPGSFFKVIAVTGYNSIESIGFIFPNKPPEQTLFSYSVTVDSIEALTGMNFFPTLPSKAEKSGEGSFTVSYWQ